MKLYMKILVFAAVIAMLLSVVGCGQDDTNSGAGKQNDGLPQVTLENKKVVLYCGLGQSLEAMHSEDKEKPQPLDIFEQNYGGELELVTVDWNEYYTKLLAKFLADDMPDVLWPMPETFPKDIISNLIQPFDDYKDYIDLDSKIWDDTRLYNEQLEINSKHYYAIQSFSQPDMVAYNPKVFELYDVEKPYDIFMNNRDEWTWDKLLELAKQLKADTNNDGVVDQWGLAIGSNGPHAFQETTGVPFVEYDKSKGVTNNFMSPVIAEAANYVRDLGSTKHNVLDPIESYNAYKDFLAGKTVMIVDVLWRITGDYQQLWADGKIEVAPMPRYPKTDKFYRGGYLFGFLLANKAKNPEGGALFITCYKYVGSEGYKEKYVGTKTEDQYKWYTDKGIPVNQAELMQACLNNFEQFPITMNIWLGWYDKGWYNGFIDLQNEPWSKIAARYYPITEKNIKKNTEKLNQILNAGDSSSAVESGVAGESSGS